MQEIPVYRWDYGKDTKVPVGVVVERRRTERGSNYIDLLRLARRRFAESGVGAGPIFIGLGHLRRRILSERAGECSARY